MATDRSQVLGIGPYSYRITSRLTEIGDALSLLYADFPTLASGGFIDFDIEIAPWRRLGLGRQRAVFRFNHRNLFSPMERRQAFATLEWGMNWCVSVHCNEYLKLHAGVIAHERGAIVMPGVPGAGKSTLCALLAMNGWRVLSDEHALVTPGKAEVTPIYRPISLKNESIDLIKRLFPEAVLGPEIKDTHKGTVSHLKADLHPDTFETGVLPIAALVFPRYSAEEPQRLTHFDKTNAFLTAAYHSFNYSLLGETGFHSMRAVVDRVPCYDLVYRDPGWAIRAFELINENALST